jgi:putative transposase
MGTYLELAAAGVPTREAASLTGLARATATRAAARALRPDPELAATRPAGEQAHRPGAGGGVGHAEQ